jgi:serine/threonine-protein kinase RsbT
MIEQRSGQVPITGESDIVIVRQFVRDRSRDLGFGITDVTRIVTAASELTRNIYLYAGAGLMQWQALQDRDRVGIELIFRDEGPGIADIDQAMELGFSSNGLLGLGLPGVKRLMDEMTLESTVGRGTTVTIRKWRRRL